MIQILIKQAKTNLFSLPLSLTLSCSLTHPHTYILLLHTHYTHILDPRVNIYLLQLSTMFRAMTLKHQTIFSITVNRSNTFILLYVVRQGIKENILENMPTGVETRWVSCLASNSQNPYKLNHMKLPFLWVNKSGQTAAISYDLK